MTTKDIKVRPIRPDEIGILITAYMSMSQDDDKMESARQYVNIRFYDIFKRGDAMAWVAEIGGDIAGVFVLKLEEHLYETPKEFLVGELMYIKKKYRKSGVARAIVDVVFPIVKKSGIKRLKMFVHNNDNKKYNEMLTEVMGLKRFFTAYEWRSDDEHQKSL